MISAYCWELWNVVCVLSVANRYIKMIPDHFGLMLVQKFFRGTEKRYFFEVWDVSDVVTSHDQRFAENDRTTLHFCVHTVRGHLSRSTETRNRQNHSWFQKTRPNMVFSLTLEISTKSGNRFPNKLYSAVILNVSPFGQVCESVREVDSEILRSAYD